MPTTSTNTVGATGRDYTTLNNWESGEQRDLTSSDEIEIAECYNDAAFVDDNINIAGWTTDSARYIKIYAPDGERHTGTINTGARWTRTYDFYWAAFIYIGEDFVRIEGLEFHPYGGGTSSKNCIRLQGFGAASTDFRIYNNLVYGDDNTTRNNHIFYVNDVDSEVTIYNNVIYRTGNTSSAVAIYLKNYTAATVYNNTVYKAYRGIRTDISSVAVVKNNACFDCYNADFSGTFATEDYNCDSDGSTSGANSKQNKTASDNFVSVTAGSEDFHVKDDSADIYASGADLSSDPTFAFDTDLDWQTRDATWEIGADEYATSGAAKSVLQAKRYYSIYKNGLLKIYIECDLYNIDAEFGDKVTIDIGRPKEQFTTAIVFWVRRTFIGKWRVYLYCIAGGYQEDEDQVWVD